VSQKGGAGWRSERGTERLTSEDKDGERGRGFKKLMCGSHGGWVVWSTPSIP
jgi:hypothetical protein